MTVERLRTKICIVGAGPAGATTSLMLAKMGIHHTIVDLANFPRDKVCGDGIDLNAVRVLNHIDPSIVTSDLMQHPGFTPSQGMRVILPNGKQVDLTRFKQNGNALLSKPIFYISKRSTFDNFLVEKIDRSFADVHLKTRIEKIEKEGENWKLCGTKNNHKIEIETDLLVGADGDHSVVLRHLGERKIDRNNYAAAVRQYWKGVEGMHPSNLIEVYFPKSLPLSYFWIFPLEDGEANVGFGMSSTHVARKKINVSKEFTNLINTDAYLAERFKNARAKETVKGWGIPLSGVRRKAYGNGWLLVGDAAAIVCPTSGEGIGSGMLSAYTAAHFIKRAVENNCFKENMFTTYNREIHKRLHADEKLYRLLHYIPTFAFTAGINMVLSNRLFQNWISKKAMHKWVETAYKTPIIVNMD